MDQELQIMTNRQINKVHYDQIDALKGIAIFLVVLGHSIIYFPVDLHENAICNFIFNWLSSVHMELFFIISGFCFSFPSNYKTYVYKKIKRLVVPYVIFNAADVVPRSMFPNLVNRPRGIEESLKKIALNGGEYWFLYVLFIIFLIYPAIYKVVHKNACNSLAAIIIILGMHYCMPSVSVFRLSSVVYYLFYFTLGTMIKLFLGNRVLEADYDKTNTLVLIIVLSIEWGILIGAGASCPQIILSLIGIFICYLSIQFEALVLIFKRFGKYSLQLYLLNGYLLVISRTIIVSVIGITNPFVIVAFNMLIDFGLSYIIIKYVCEKIKIAKVLMGIL